MSTLIFTDVGSYDKGFFRIKGSWYLKLKKNPYYSKKIISLKTGEEVQIHGNTRVVWILGSDKLDLSQLNGHVFYNREYRPFSFFKTLIPFLNSLEK